MSAKRDIIQIQEKEIRRDFRSGELFIRKEVFTMRGLLPFNGFFGDNVFDDFFNDVPVLYNDQVTVPKVDIEEKKDSYEITCDMPGFNKDQIHVSYENGVLSLSAKKEAETVTKEDDRHFIRRERSSSTFRRQFAVKGIKEDAIKAALNDGVLTVTLPKMKEEIQKAPHRIEIE